MLYSTNSNVPPNNMSGPGFQQTPMGPSNGPGPIPNMNQPLSGPPVISSMNLIPPSVNVQELEDKIKKIDEELSTLRDQVLQSETNLSAQRKVRFLNLRHYLNTIIIFFFLFDLVAF